MDIQTIFQRLGLPKHSHRIYRILQTNGPLLASPIAHSIGIHRPALYRALRALIEHRFVFPTSKGRRTVYNAAHAQVIVNEFKKTSSVVTSFIAKQSAQQDAYIQKEIRLLHGPKGIRAAFDDVIEHTPKGETFYRYTSEKDLNAVNRYLSSDYRTRRDAKKIERLVISNPVSGKQKRPRLERFVKYIPSEISLFDQNIIQLVYGDRVSLIDLNTEQVIIIENKQLADFQKVIFKQFYKKL